MQVAPEHMPKSEVQQPEPPVAWSSGSEENQVQRASRKVLFTLSDLSAGDAKDDELVSKLKSLDINKDGRFSSEEIINAAKELVDMRHQKDAAVQSQRRMGWITLLIGFLLLLSIIINSIGAFWAVWLNKDTKASGESGIMMTYVSGRQTPKPVASGSIRIAAQGLSGLKEASKEELEALEELRFFHDGGFHRMKVSQLHRYDGRIEVWGWPAGAVVVEDTGEVHYSPYVVPSSTWDDCWGPTGTLTDVCGVAVDNEPPTSLEVEEDVQQDAADGASNDSVPPPGGRRLVEVGTDSSGKPVFEEAAPEDPDAVAAARRLSGRRRSGSSYSSPRRRSGGYSSARRRSFGGTASSSTSYGSTSYRRRLSGTGSRRRSPSYSATEEITEERATDWTFILGVVVGVGPCCCFCVSFSLFACKGDQ